MIAGIVADLAITVGAVAVVAGCERLAAVCAVVVVVAVVAGGGR